MTREEILKTVEDEGIKFIKMMFVDIKGVAKAIEVTHYLLESALDNKVTIDGSSVEGMTTVENSDLILVPDLNSFRRFPIEDSEFGSVAILMCFVVKPDGTSADGCVRSVLNKELKNMNGIGFDRMNVGFEPEFFLLRDRAELLDNGSYADTLPSKDGTAHIRHEIMFEFERCGIIPLTCHHERAPSQCEITFKYADALRSCDNLILYKIIVEKVAKKHNLIATLEPKPFDGVNGCGLHTNISLSKDGKKYLF